MYHAVSPFCPKEHQSNEPLPSNEFLATTNSKPDPWSKIRLFLLLALLLLLEDLLDNLLLLDQESSDDAVTDTATASGTTISTLDGLLGL